MKPDTATIDIRAVVLLIILCASWGLNQVAIKVAIAGVPPVLQAGPLAKVSPGKVLLYQLGISAVILPPASVLLGEPGIQTLSPLVISSLAYQIIWVAFITYVAWFWLIRAYPVSRLAPFTFLTPLFGVMAGAWLLGETVTLYLLMALIMVGAGIYLVNRK